MDRKGREEEKRRKTMWLKTIKYQSPKFKLFKDKDGTIKIKKIKE